MGLATFETVRDALRAGFSLLEHTVDGAIACEKRTPGSVVPGVVVAAAGR